MMEDEVLKGKSASVDPIEFGTSIVVYETNSEVSQFFSDPEKVAAASKKAHKNLSEFLKLSMSQEVNWEISPERVKCDKAEYLGTGLQSNVYKGTPFTKQKVT